MAVVIMQKTDSLCTDEINHQFVVDASDVLMTVAAELLVMKANEVLDSTRLNLDQQIKKLDRLVDQAQILLIQGGYEYAWLQDRYVITREVASPWGVNAQV